MAEDPGNGESFGMHRCRLVAEGIVEAFQRGDQTVAGRLAAIAGQFEKAGVRLEAPYLGAKSSELEAPARAVEFAYA
jgi:hypothetical protein